MKIENYLKLHGNGEVNMEEVNRNLFLCHQLLSKVISELRDHAATAGEDVDGEPFQLSYPERIEISKEERREMAIKRLNDKNGLEEIILTNRLDSIDILSSFKFSSKNSLRSLIFNRIDNTLAAIELIVSCQIHLPKLEHLEFDFRKIEIERYAIILPGLRLRKLGAHTNEIVGLDEFSVFCLRNLTHLVVEQNFTYDCGPADPEDENLHFQIGLNVIRDSCQVLKILSSNLTDSTIDIVSRMGSLKSLTFSCSQFMSTRCFDLLANNEKLTHLIISDEENAFPKYDWLSFFRNARFKTVLEEFILYSPYVLTPSFIDDMIKICSHLNHLRIIYL